MFKIVLASRGKVIEKLKNFPYRQEAVEEFGKMVKENHKSVVFPKEWIKIEGIGYEADYELLLLKRRCGETGNVFKVRDDTGKFVEYEFNNPEWILFDRARWYKEEEFYVYGHHPMYDKKSFNWIYDNLIKTSDKDDIKNVMVLINKLVIDKSGEPDFVICRNISQAIKLYNMIYDRCEKDKLRNIIFSGNMSHKENYKWCMEKLSELTGWGELRLRSWTLLMRPPEEREGEQLGRRALMSQLSPLQTEQSLSRQETDDNTVLRQSS